MGFRGFRHFTGACHFALAGPSEAALENASVILRRLFTLAIDAEVGAAFFSLYLKSSISDTMVVPCFMTI